LNFAATREIEVLLESAPFLLLQAYVFVVGADRAIETLISLVISYVRLVSIYQIGLADGLLQFSLKKLIVAVDSLVVIFPWVFFLKAYTSVAWRASIGVVYVLAVVLINRNEDYEDILISLIITPDMNIGSDAI